MFSMLLRKHSSTWNRFYGPSNDYIKYNQSQYIDSIANFYAENVIFESFSPNGVIRFVNGNFYYKILISKSFFSNSYSMNSGGSIYVNNAASTIQFRVCSINSTIPDLQGDEYSGCHSYDISSESHIIESSISKSNGYSDCIAENYGHRHIVSTNISYTKCIKYAGYSCVRTESCKTSFNSFCNNEGEIIIYVFYRDIFIDHCNFIQNFHSEKTVGMYKINNARISLSTFISNSAKYMIFAFPVESFYGFDCFVQNNSVKEIFFKFDEDGWLIRYDNLDVNKYLKTISCLDLRLSHLSTYGCDAVFPFVKMPKTLSLNHLYQNSNKQMRIY